MKRRSALAPQLRAHGTAIMGGWGRGSRAVLRGIALLSGRAFPAPAGAPAGAMAAGARWTSPGMFGGGAHCRRGFAATAPAADDVCPQHPASQPPRRPRRRTFEENPELPSPPPPRSSPTRTRKRPDHPGESFHPPAPRDTFETLEGPAPRPVLSSPRRTRSRAASEPPARRSSRRQIANEHRAQLPWVVRTAPSRTPRVQ